MKGRYKFWISILAIAIASLLITFWSNPIVPKITLGALIAIAAVALFFDGIASIDKLSKNKPFIYFYNPIKGYIEHKAYYINDSEEETSLYVVFAILNPLRLPLFILSNAWIGIGGISK